MSQINDIEEFAKMKDEIKKMREELMECKTTTKELEDFIESHLYRMQVKNVRDNYFYKFMGSIGVTMVFIFISVISLEVSVELSYIAIIITVIASAFLIYFFFIETIFFFEDLNKRRRTKKILNEVRSENGKK